ncbi:MAG TPA: FCD domain-containing protein [Gaiellaceae bacterium]|nr:FCD domain-containing protein [Gaiellaceae bacterium]
MSISNSASSEAWLDAGDLRAVEDATATLPERIERRIGELIEAGTLAAGARLPSERELARIFGVSRLAVREAAHRLEARGLVVVRRGSGSFVAAPAAGAEPAEAQAPLAGANGDELADVRLLLEPAAADWAARRAERSSVAVLLRIAEQFEAAVDEPDPRFDLLAASDMELHLEIAHAADNALLARLIEELHGIYRLQLEWSLRRPGRLEETAAEHRRLVDAIAAGDPAGARDAMTAHLNAAAASFRLAPRSPSLD